LEELQVDFCKFVSDRNRSFAPKHKRRARYMCAFAIRDDDDDIHPTDIIIAMKNTSFKSIKVGVDFMHRDISMAAICVEQQEGRSKYYTYESSKLVVSDVKEYNKSKRLKKNQNVFIQCRSLAKLKVASSYYDDKYEQVTL
jgi:hypothetical protein